MMKELAYIYVSVIKKYYVNTVTLIKGFPNTLSYTLLDIRILYFVLTYKRNVHNTTHYGNADPLLEEQVKSFYLRPTEN